MVGSSGAVLQASTGNPFVLQLSHCGHCVVLGLFPGTMSCNLRVLSCTELSLLFEVKATEVPQQGSPIKSSDALQDLHRWQSSKERSSNQDLWLVKGEIQTCLWESASLPRMEGLL